MAIVTVFSPVGPGRPSLWCLLSLVLAGAACTGRSCRQPERRPLEAQAWAVACVENPEELWNITRAAWPPASAPPRQIATLLGDLLGLPAAQLHESVNWSHPAVAVLYAPQPGGNTFSAWAVRFRRPPGPGQREGRRSVSNDQGALVVEGDRQHLWVASAPAPLEALRQQPPATCATSTAARSPAPLTFYLSAELLGNDRAMAWYEERLAWLEATAREATRSHPSRPTLGNPEILARTLADALRRVRTRARELAPWQVAMTPSPSGLTIDIETMSTLNEPGPEPTASPPPWATRAERGAWLWASRGSAASRQRLVRRLVDTWAAVAEDRFLPDHAHELGQALSRVAETSRGWWTAALLPGPSSCGAGDAALNITIASPSPEATGRAVRDVIPLLARGYPLQALRHASLDLSSPSQAGTDRHGTVTFLGRTEGHDGLWGSRPTLTWTTEADSLRLLLASESLGSDNRTDCISPDLPNESASPRERSPLDEVADIHGQATTYFLVRPAVLLRWLSSHRPRRSVSRDEPSLSGGHVAGAAGPGGSSRGWRLVVHVDRQQVQTIASFLVERRRQP